MSPAPRHRLRPRYGRIATAGLSLALTVVAVLGGVGMLGGTAGSAADGTGAGAVASPASAELSSSSAPDDEATTPDPSPPSTEPTTPAPTTTAPTTTAPSRSVRSSDAAGVREDTGLPAASGEGQRVVYSESRQRVWLVDEDGAVERSYLVSGSVYDNLQPGTFSVYSTSRWAVGIDDSGVMQYFVRFAHGDTGAAIGFHTIPTKDGVPLQRVGQLGTPQSHGCIRQRTSDAVALWEFAPVGTTVVVTA